jgi:hypothetical protein
MPAGLFSGMLGYPRLKHRGLTFGALLYKLPYNDTLGLA